MRLLLNTHAFLWFFTNDPKLSDGALALIADPHERSPGQSCQLLGSCYQGQAWQISAECAI